MCQRVCSVASKSVCVGLVHTHGCLSMNRGVSAQHIRFTFNATHTVCPAFLAHLVSHKLVARKPELTLSKGRARSCSYMLYFSFNHYLSRQCRMGKFDLSQWHSVSHSHSNKQEHLSAARASAAGRTSAVT